MIIAKYSLPIFLIGVTFLAIGLDHIWRDKGTTSYKLTKRILLWVIIPLALMVNIATIYLQEQYDIDLKKEITGLTKTSATLSKNLAQLRIKLRNRIDELATLKQQNKMVVMLEQLWHSEKNNINALIKEYPLGYILFALNYQNRIIPYDKPSTNVEYSINWDKSKILSIDIEAIRVSIRGVKLGDSYCDEIIFNIERNKLEPQPQLHAGELLPEFCTNYLLWLEALCL
jgi:hypothetical protein